MIQRIGRRLGVTIAAAAAAMTLGAAPAQAAPAPDKTGPAATISAVTCSTNQSIWLTYFGWQVSGHSYTGCSQRVYRVVAKVFLQKWEYGAWREYGAFSGSQVNFNAYSAQINSASASCGIPGDKWRARARHAYQVTSSSSTVAWDTYSNVLTCPNY